jgi:hypothetical protein
MHSPGKTVLPKKHPPTPTLDAKDPQVQSSACSTTVDCQTISVIPITQLPYATNSAQLSSAHHLTEQLSSEVEHPKT